VSTSSIWVRAGGTLTEFSFVKNSSGAVVLQGTDTGKDTIGVCQTSAVSGDMVEVVVEGWTSVKSGAAVTAGVSVMTNSSGLAIDHSGATKAPLGMYLPEGNDGAAMANGGSGDIIRILLYSNKSQALTA
jgi:nitrous oxidase accessory protein NosD